MTMRAYDNDVLIVGGGPAGLATAMAAAARGLSVLVADGGEAPLDKACGEGLMPDSLAALEALGVRLRGAVGAPIRGIRFCDDAGARAEAAFRGAWGLGLRRTRLHALLLERAEAQGVRFLWRAPVSGVEGGYVSLPGGPKRARWIVGADGLQSRVRRWAGLEACTVRSRRIAQRLHYRMAAPSDLVEVHWSDRGQAYVTPVGPDQVGVAFISGEKHASLEAALANFPALRRMLAGAAPCTRVRGSATLSRRLRRVTRGHLALVGDASGSVDAITGEGLGLSFRQAISLADAMAAGDLAGYESAHHAIQRRALLMARILLLMDRSRGLRGRALDAFAESPGLFARMLGVHLGEIPLRWFGDAGLLRLGWEMLRA
jgi:flavin-dependent dehydrogenase